MTFFVAAPRKIFVLHETASRCSGLQHDGLRHRWSMWSLALIVAPDSSSATRCAGLTLRSCCALPYPDSCLPPCHSQHPESVSRHLARMSSSVLTGAILRGNRDFHRGRSATASDLMCSSRSSVAGPLERGPRRASAVPDGGLGRNRPEKHRMGWARTSSASDVDKLYNRACKRCKRCGHSQGFPSGDLKRGGFGRGCVGWTRRRSCATCTGTLSRLATSAGHRWKH